MRAPLIGTHVESEDGRTWWFGGGWYATRLRRDGEGWLLTSVEPRPTWLQITGGAKGPGPATR